MKLIDKVEQPDQDIERPDEYEGFVSLLKHLVAAPKTGIRREAEEWERAKADRRSA